MDDRTCDRLPDATLSPRPARASVGPDPRLSRRRLLGGAGGGFVLAASGLLVPEGAGAEKPVDRLLNHRGDRHRRQDRHRKDRHRKDRNDHDRKAIQEILDVELNYYSGYTLARNIQVWQGSRFLPPTWDLIADLRVSPGPGPSRTLEKFTGSTPNLVLVVLTNSQTGPLVFQVENPPVLAPSLVVGQGTWSRQGWVNRGHIYFSNGVKEGERVNVPGFYVDRSPDSPNHKIFYINAND